MRLCWDTEAKDLLNANSVDYTASPYKLKDPAYMHCAGFMDVDSDKEFIFVGRELGRVKEFILDTATELIGHNTICFDHPAAKAALGLDFEIGRREGKKGEFYTLLRDTVCGKPITITDTLVMSKTLNPDRVQHSIAYFGKLHGEEKIDWRAIAVSLGLCKATDPKGAEFKIFHTEITKYMMQDVKSNIKTWRLLLKEWGEWNWSDAYDLEKDVADVISRQEHRGFWFDSEKAVACVKDLDEKMAKLKDVVEPLIPPKPLGITAAKQYIPPAKQFKKDGTPNAHITNFISKHGGELLEAPSGYCTVLYDQEYALPLPQKPIVTHAVATIKDTTHIKGWLVSIGWSPTAYKERDLTVDSKKHKLTKEKYTEACERYIEQTMSSPFKRDRLDELEVFSEPYLRKKLLNHDHMKRPLKVYTNPTLTVGMEKEIDPALLEMSDKFAHAKDVSDYLTFSHRRNSILGGNVDPDDAEEDAEKGYMSVDRINQDHRIPTPADTCGAGCVIGSTLIITDNGLVPITDIGIGDLVLTHDGTYQRVLDRIQNGIKPVARVRFANGNEVIATLNHPFLTPGGWKRLDSLVVDTEVFTYQEEEQWKQLKNYSSYYVSSWGRILNSQGEHLKTSKRIALWSRAEVDLIDDLCLKHREGIGRLVLKAFIGAPPSDTEACHKDGNPTNNHLKNLYWGTSKENSGDAALHGRALKKARSRSTNKLSQETVNEIKEHFLHFGYTRGDDTKLSKLYGVTRRTIGDIREGGRWKEGNIENLYKENFDTTKVVSIDVLSSVPTYDITVENLHSYVSNGIVTHNTSRFKHRVVANIPRITSLYGQQMRSLFGVDVAAGFIQLGYDFDSLEANIEAHYVYKYPGGIEYGKSLTAAKPNDCHTLLAAKISTLIGKIFNRNPAKNVKYGCSYNAQAKRVAKTVGCDLETGQVIFDAFWEYAAPLKLLKEKMQSYWETTGQKKFLMGIDGRKLPIRSKGNVINTAFQSAGVIAAKRCMVIHDRKLRAEGLIVDFWRDDWKSANFCQQLCAYHDEAQLEVLRASVTFKKFESEADAKVFTDPERKWSDVIHNDKGWFRGYCRAGELAVEAVAEAGEYYKLNVPLTAGYVLGRNWSECH